MSWVPFASRTLPYPTAVQQVLACYGNAAKHGRGRIIFLTGDTGASRGALDAVRGALAAMSPPPLLLEGELHGNKYVPRAVMSPPTQPNLIDYWLAIATRMGGLINPVGGWIGHLAQTLLIQWRMDAIADAAPDLESSAALPTILRRAADIQAWKGAGPVVCLIDGLEGAPDWVDIVRHLGRQLAVDVPVLLCFGVDGPLMLPDEPDDYLLLVAKHLTSPDVDQATWVPLPPLTLEQVEEWIGPVDHALARRLYEVTQGNPRQTRELWSHWQQRGIVYLSYPGDRWEIAPGHEERILADVDDIVRERLHDLLGTESDRRIDEALHLLEWGAREGRTFTTDVLVHILRTHGDKDPDLRDKIVDFLDDTLHAADDHPSAVVVEAEPATGVDPRTGGPRTLWRYAFTADLYWRALRHYGVNRDETTTARAVAEALVAVYGSEVSQVARTVAQLFDEVGDKQSARPYHRMAMVATSREALRWRARALLEQQTEDWTFQEQIWATSLLLKAGGQMLGAVPPEETLAVAEAAHELAVRTHQRTDQIDALNLLGRAHSQVGRPRRGQPYVESALKLSQSPPTDRRREATSLNNLGSLLQAQGDLAGARPYYERALAIYERVLGPDHPETATSLNNLGGLLQDQGDLAAARPYYERALAIYERVLGPNHPNTLRVRGNLQSLVD